MSRRVGLYRVDRASSEQSIGTAYGDGWNVEEYESILVVAEATDVGSSGTVIVTPQICPGPDADGPYIDLAAITTVTVNDTPKGTLYTGIGGWFRTKRVVATDAVTYSIKCHLKT